MFNCVMYTGGVHLSWQVCSAGTLLANPLVLLFITLAFPQLSFVSYYFLVQIGWLTWIGS